MGLLSLNFKRVSPKFKCFSLNLGCVSLKFKHFLLNFDRVSLKFKRFTLNFGCVLSKYKRFPPTFADQITVLTLIYMRNLAGDVGFTNVILYLQDIEEPIVVGGTK